MPNPTEPELPITEEEEPDYSYLVPPEAIPDTSKIIVRDGAPLESMFAERQARLLSDTLITNWKSPSGQPFLALTDVGLFATANGKPLVPDMMLSLDVPAEIPAKASDDRSYFAWIIGKMPEVVIEFVSDHRAKEHTVKKAKYQKLHIPYFVVFDPDDVLGEGELQTYEFKEGSYQPIESAWLPLVGLGLRIWTGDYCNRTRRWLRWCDAGGEVIPTGFEKLASVQEHADIEAGRAAQSERKLTTERQRADEANQRADDAAEKIRQLIEKLKAAGIDPN